MVNIVLILDIDGTLVTEVDTEHDYKLVKPRPGLKEFLTLCFQVCDHVSVWTAASPEWFGLIYSMHLKDILDELKVEFDFVYCQDRCSVLWDTDPEDYHPKTTRIKPLRKVWRSKDKYNKHNTLILDDTPITYMKNYGNAIPIKKYTGEINDSELHRVGQLLIKLKESEYPIRHTEKRT